MWEDVGRFMGPLVLGIIITMALEALTGRALGVIIRQRFLMRAKKRFRAYSDQGELVERGQERLYVLEFVQSGWRVDELVLAMGEPPQLIREFERADSSVLPSSPERLVALIEDERERLKTFPNGEWNGESLGIRGITISRTRSSERPFLKIDVYKSDHAAGVASGNAWLTAFDENVVTFPSEGEYIPGLGHTVGLNATVVTDDKKLILVRRSVHASSARGGWHISVNEGMLPEDTRGGRLLDARVGLVRGMREELGIDAPIDTVLLHTAMFDVRRYQFGLLGHVDLRGTGITAADIIAARQSGLSKDRFENSKLECIDWELQTVLNKLREPDWIAHGWLNLVNSAIAKLADNAKQIADLQDTRLVASKPLG